jgi:16S rRNA (adenine1518-N6/adenine1519-N6)-dimethyltransferase
MTQEPDQESLSTLLRKYDIQPDKKLGQNFLTDPSILSGIVETAGVSDQDIVLEIGAGLGHLTGQLAKTAKQVIAVELDHRLIPALEDRLASLEKIQIVQGDILTLDLADLIQEDNYLVVANIPYYITSAIIRYLLESARRPRKIILTIQYEVAQRICSSAGRMSILALSVRMYGNPSLAFRIPAEAFYPAPKVDSAVVEVDLLPQPLLSVEKRENFFQLIKAGFLHKRKTIKNSLSKGLAWSPKDTEALLITAKIDPSRRAETLSVPEWLELTAHYDTILRTKTNADNSKRN